MAADDMRYYETYYAIHTDDWDNTFGSFTDSNKLLVKDYINSGCSFTDTSTASDVNKFLYPHHIKKVYFIEGVIEGQITFAASTATSTVSQYRVTVSKTEDGNSTTADDIELFTTGWIVPAVTLTWDSTYSIGEERVFPFWMDAWEAEKLVGTDRLYLKVETKGTNTLVLYHSNDSTWNDIKITIPLRM